MLAELINNSVQNKYFPGKTFKDFLPNYFREADTRSDEQRLIDAERAFVDKALITGFGVMDDHST